MHIRLWAAVYFIVVVGITASAQSVSLSGMVKNNSGKPIAGATVKLAVKNLSATTDADGKYAIKKTSLVTPDPILPNVESISMDKGIISISLAKSAPVRIEMFDIRGNMLERVINHPASAGGYRFNVMTHPLAANMMVIRVSIGQRSSTFRYLPLNNGRRAITTSVALSSIGAGMAALQAVVDTLKVFASNYKQYTEALSTLEGVKDITLDSITLEKFSFFVTSLKALQDLSKSQNGFGGDFRFGKTGQGAGLLGADSICECIAERSMPGSKVKQWRAFLSVAKGPDGTQVNAIDRIGKGPWYDRRGRILSNNITELLNTRPAGADAAIKNDLPNEDGVPNHRPEGTTVDNHHFVTGSGTDGKLYHSGSTCDDWTSVTASGKPRFGYSWPRGSRGHWISGMSVGGCKAGIQITEQNDVNNPIIGAAGGYGGFYCFALNP